MFISHEIQCSSVFGCFGNKFLVTWLHLFPQQGHIQVTYVETYFEEWELRQRVTVFDKGFNIRRFVFNTPYTPGGKARGELQEQWVRKTILTTEKSFPYLKRRLRVVATEKVGLPKRTTMCVYYCTFYLLSLLSPLFSISLLSPSPFLSPFPLLSLFLFLSLSFTPDSLTDNGACYFVSIAYRLISSLLR